MRRAPLRRVAATAIATMLTVATTASAATAPPKSLTNKFPLGTQTLCCQSHTPTKPKASPPAQSGANPPAKSQAPAPPQSQSHTQSHSQSQSQSQTTSKSSSTAAVKQPAPANGHSTNPPATTQPQSQPASAAGKPHKDNGHATRNLLLIGLVALVIVVVIGDWLLVRRSHRIPARPRRRIPGAVLRLLFPLYRYDRARDAWVLRLIGDRYGPVLRPNGYRAAPLHGFEGDEDLPTRAVDPVETPEPAVQHAPDPFTPPAASRSRPRRDARTGNSREEHEPPPLVIRRRPD